MADEFLNWTRDLGQYFTQLRNRSRLRGERAGVDYASGQYRDLVRRTVERLHPDRMRLRVIEIVEETPTTKTFRFGRLDGAPPPFRAGQYLNLFVKIGKVSTSRPYSISSRPGLDYLDLTVRRKPGGFVSPHLLDAAKVGDEFVSSGPAGQFYHEPLIDRGELVMIGGGSGITPFASICRDFARKLWPVKSHLIYGSRDESDVIFGEEFDRLAAGAPRFNYDLVLSEPAQGFTGTTGFITAELIKTRIGSVKDKTFLVCGPTAMYEFVLPELAKLAVPAHKIRREAFGPPDDVTRQPGWPQGLKANARFTVKFGGAKPFYAAAGEPLINSIERAGLSTPAQCRSGECSICRLRLVSGEVYLLPNVGLRESDRDFGYIHACASYPLSDVELRL